MLKPSVAANRPPTHITLSVHWSEQKSSTLLLKFEIISQQPSKPPHIYAVKPLKPQVDIVHNLGAWKSSNHITSKNTFSRYIFSQVYSLYFFLIFAHLWWFGVWGFGVGVLYCVFGVGVFSYWGLGPAVWSLLGFLGMGLSI